MRTIVGVVIPALIVADATAEPAPQPASENQVSSAPAAAPPPTTGPASQRTTRAPLTTAPTAHHFWITPNPSQSAQG